MINFKENVLENFCRFFLGYHDSLLWEWLWMAFHDYKRAQAIRFF